MGVLTMARQLQQEQGLRPLDVLRDLDGIAKLIDIAFADDIALEGSQFLHELTFLTFASPAMWALRRISAEMRDAFDGFVWIEDGRVVGNVTLTRDSPTRRVWTISNVAVHPDFRRRGLGRALMQASLAAVTDRGGGPVALQVKAGNKAAYDLYLGLGFRLVDGLVTARLSDPLAHPFHLGGTARPVRTEEWPLIYNLVKAARSPLADRISPLSESDYRRTLLRRFADALSDMWGDERRFWLAVEDKGQFLAAARVHLRPYGGSAIDLTIHPDGRNHVEEGLLQSALAACTMSAGKLTVHVPSDNSRAQELLWRYNFTEARHLHRLMIELEENTNGRDE